MAEISRATETIAALEEAGTGNRLNDGRTDPAGRYVVGSMWADATIEQRTGVLHSYAADGAHTALAELWWERLWD